jgi:hypothetical protein
MRLWVAVLALGVTFAGTARAYRTLTDEPQLAIAGGEPVAWSQLPIRFEVHHQEADVIGAAELRAVLERGMAVWNASACTSGAFETVGATDRPAQLGDGRNTVQWVHSDWSAYGGPRAAAATLTMFRNQAGDYSLVDADIYLNGERAWDAEMLDQIEGVLAHELGHALGLAHPCEEDGAQGAPRCEGLPVTLMHPRYGDMQSFMLTADDEAGACFLYSTAASSTEPSGCSVASPGGGQPYTPLFSMVLVLVSIAFRAIRSTTHPRYARARPSYRAC